MDCKACRNEIELSPTGERVRAAEALAHMRSCARCRDFSAERRALFELVSSLEAVSAPHDFEWRLRARLNADKRGNQGGARFRPGFAPGTQAIALAASFALLIGVAVVFKQMSSESFVASPQVEVARVNAANVVKPSNTEWAKLSEAMVVSANNRINTTISLTSGRARNASAARAASEASETLSASAAPASIMTLSDPRVRSNDFSSSAAPVITLFAVPVKDPAEHLKVLLDEGHGITRTVSLQNITFGSQAILERKGGAAAVPSLDSNADGIW